MLLIKVTVCDQTVESRFLKPPYNLNEVVSLPHSNTVNLPLISRNLQFLKLIFVSLGGLKKSKSPLLQV